MDKHIWKFVQNSGIEIDDDLEDFGFTREVDTTLAYVMSMAHTEELVTIGEWRRANKENI